jgi:hypothetical protein
LVRYFTVNNLPQHLPSVDSLLAKYEGIEDELWYLVISKFGFWIPPTDSPNTILAQKIFAFYQTYEPTKANQRHVDLVIQKYGHDEAQLWSALKAAYGLK